MKRLILIISFFIFLFSFFPIKSFSVPRNVLVEFSTGTWCGWCPCGHQALESILAMYPQTVAIAYHGASSDPWQNFNGNQIRSLLGFTAYPTGIIDRGNTPSNPYVTYDMWMTRVQNRYTSSPNSNMSMSVTSKSFNPSTRELSFTVNSIATDNLVGQYKISFVLIEDNVIYQQNHYSQCGMSGYVQNYNHTHIARSMLNGPTGEILNTNSVWNENEMISKSVNTVVDNAWVPENCRVVCFVYKDSSVLALANVEQAINDDILTGISGNQSEIVQDYSLSQNYPNPFNPSTRFTFSIPKDENVSLKFYDILGNEVETYVDGFMKAGIYNVEFNASELSSGVYFYKIIAGNFTDTKRMILAK